jgi:glutathione S-transferase
MVVDAGRDAPPLTFHPHEVPPMTQPRVTFFHAPQSRSGGTRALFEELGVDYDLHVLSLKAGEQRQPAYLAVNPMGKVPAILHGDALITEQPAVFMYLADLYPQAKLAPPIGDPRRGPYLRWLVYYGSCFEPAVVDKSMQREPAPPSTCGYGDYDTMLKTLTDQLEKGPYLLGDTFSAADVLWGTALNWTTMFKLVPELPVIRAYIDRVMSRPAMQRAAAADAELAATQSA